MPFFQRNEAPCRHIFQFDESIDADIFLQDLVSHRWTYEHNSIVNVRNRAAEIRETEHQ